MKICVVYHDDADGKCSAAIVAYYYNNADITFIPYNYYNDVSKYIHGYDILYILDCALDTNLMTKLFEDEYKINLIWIDHHKSNIMNINSSIYGLRKLNGGSACKLTWNYFFSKDMPSIVKYISDFDEWKYEYGNLTKGFTEWLNNQNDNPSNYELWFSLFKEKNIGNYIDKGMIMYNARIISLKKDIEELSYEDEIDGIKCLKMNYSSLRSISDAGNIMLEKGYDISWVWYRTKNGKIYNSLRGNGKYDVSKIAENHGGGGHKKASGFIE